MASNSIKKYIAKLKANENWVGDNASSEKSKSTNLDWRSEYIARIKSGAAAKTYDDEQKSKALLRNNPGYVYNKVYGDGAKGKAAASKIETGKGNGYISVWDGDAVKRNNPGYAYLQQAGGGEKLTKGSDAISAGDIEWYKKILRGVDVGLTDFGKSLVSAADVVTSLGDEDGGPLQELWYMFGGDRIAEAAGDNALGIKGLNFKDNPIKAFNKLGEKEIEYRQKRDAAYADNLLYDYSAMTAEAVAMMASTLMGGGLAAATDTAALANASRIGQAASKLSQTGAIAQNAIKQFATRPDAQVIFGSAFGSSYDEAKQDGADDLQALVYAALNGAGNAVTELGGVSELGGLQKLPEWVKKAANKGDKSLLLNYAKSIGEEASEEIIQGILGRGLKSIYSDVPLYDANDENSIINPKAALEEATGAAVVSTLLGLPTTGINAAYRAKQRGETGQRLYGNSQRELVDEGLESERGTKSYELARKYDEKLNNGKQLSGNELYRLAQANEKAQVNEGTAVQSAPETQLNEESPALPHAALNREQQLSELRNYVAQRSEMSAPVNTNVSNNEAVSKSINNVAAKIDATPEFVSRVYNLNPVESPEAFEMAFDAVYQMGQQGANKESLTKVPVLSTAQANIAYQMGADSVMSTETAAPVTNNNTQEVNDNGVRIHNVAERINGQNTEGQIRGVETGTGENGAGGSQKEQGGAGAAQIKTGEKVSYKGKQQKGVYYAAEDTEGMKKGRKLAESYGYKVTYFVGGNIRYAGGEFRGVVDTANKTVMVRADHPDYTAEQIMRHEMGHAAFENGDLSLNEAKEMLLDNFTEDELNELIEIYSSEYGGILSPDEAFEEICCDALGRMNIFEGTDLNSESYGKAQDTVRKYAADKTGSKGRAPPKKGEVKYSREASLTNATKAIQNMGRKSINDFTSADIEKTRPFAEKYWREMGTKSPFFKAWFGDWRTNDKTAAAVVNVGGGSFKAGKTVNKDTGTVLSWGDVLKKETIVHQSSGGVASRALGAIEDIVENAILLDTYTSSLSSKTKLPGTAFMHSYYTVANYEGTDYLLKLFAEEAVSLKNGEIFTRAYELKDIKKVAALPNGVLSQTGGLTDGNTSTTLTVADIAAIVKKYDKSYNPRPASKVVNEDGTPKIVYHQTENEFTVFETRRAGAGTRDNGTPFGIFLKSSNKDIGLRGKKQMALYARIESPLRAKNRSELLKAMQSMSSEYAEIINRHEELDHEYKEKTQSAMREFKNYMIEWRADNPGVDSRALYDDAKFNELFEAEDTLTSEWTEKADMLSTKAKEALTKALESNGYDGVILERDDGSFGRSTDAYIALRPEQVKSATDNIGTFDSSNPDIRYSLEPVKPIQPKNGEWERGSTTDEVRAKHPDLWAVDAESSESRNPTQISGTVKSYRKIYDALKAEGFNGTVLDASSGLGYGTRAGIEEYGFNVEDIEPFPDSSYKPKYTDYSKLHKKYDVIISNAVLNVLPQDQRDALVVKMGQMLNDGGRMFINVRGTDVRNASSKVPIGEANMEYYISNTGSYQKGFTKKELVAYLSDALGKDYTIVGTNKFGAVSAVVTKQAEVSKKFSREPERLNELRRQNERKLAQATAEDAANENERGLIRDYQKQYSKVEDIREKLSTAQQALTEAEDSGADYDTTAKAKNRFTVLSNQYAREHRKLESYAKMKALQNVLTRVDERLGNDLPEGMGAASAEFTGEETRGERWVTEAQGKGNNALHPISREQEANLAEQQHRAPQEIPKEDLNGKLTSKHVSTLANSGVTPAEFSDALREDAAQGKFSHIAYSDEAALKKAEITIEANGWEQALADYKAQINAGKVSKDNTVMGIALYNNAVNSGDYATALDIASLMVKNSTNTAQSLQAMRILNKLSPECKLYLAAKSVETIEEDLNEKYKDNKADIHVDKALYDEYGKALRSGDEDGIKTAWAKIEQSVAQQIDATWYEKLNNFRYLAMLGNPRTHVRNIVGNAFFVPVRAVKNTIAYGLENVADSKVNGGIERSKAMLNRNNANDVALIKYAMTDYEAVQETILSGGKYVDTFQGIDKKRTIYKTKILEAARKGNSNLLDAEDAWFCKPAYANALAKWYKANGITAEQLNTGKVPENTIIKAQAVAVKEAQKATYRDTNRFSAMVSRLGKVDNKIASALIEGVLPFKKTPANILVRAVEYSPVGLIKSLAVDTKKVKAYVNGDVENGMPPAQFIDDVSAGLTGTALVGLGVLLASWGLFSGSPGDDDKQNKFDELGGSQNYALNIGGLSITLDWLAPESMPLFVGVELYNSLSGKSEDNGFVQNLMSSVMSLSTPMFEMSMLQSVNDLFDNLAYIKQGQGSFKIVTSMATNYISQYFPTLFGQVERAFGENQRETTYIDRNSNVGSELQYMWGKIANKIPLYDFSQIPYIDAWGRTEETGNLFERVLNNFVNPAYVKKERSTEIDGELKRLYDLGETSVYPSRAKTNTKINGEYLTAEEYVKYATAKGQTSYDLATKIINSSTYSRASDAEKAYMLSYVYKYADHIAKYEVNDESSLAKWEAAAYKSSNPAQGIIDHAQEYYKRKENDES